VHGNCNCQEFSHLKSVVQRLLLVTKVDQYHSALKRVNLAGDIKPTCGLLAPSSLGVRAGDAGPTRSRARPGQRATPAAPTTTVRRVGRRLGSLAVQTDQIYCVDGRRGS